jgi:hypothetical protein
VAQAQNGVALGSRRSDAQVEWSDRAYQVRSQKITRLI